MENKEFIESTYEALRKKRVEPDALSAMQDLCHQLVGCEKQLEERQSELDKLSTRFTELIQQNSALAAENERLSEKLAAMESQEPVAYGIPNTAITGRKQRFMTLHLDRCGQYPELMEPLYALPVPADKPKSKHKDDIAVDRFADAMKKKLAKARAKGRSGWDTCACDDRRLAAMLMEHTLKGNDGSFEDVANFAMMLHQRGANPKVLADAAKGNRFTPAEREAVARALSDKPAVAVPDDDVVSTLDRVVDGLENQIGNAGLRNDLYDAGYLRAIKREVLKLRDTLAATPSQGQQSVEWKAERYDRIEIALDKYYRTFQINKISAQTTLTIELITIFSEARSDRCPSHESEQVPDIGTQGYEDEVMMIEGEQGGAA